MIEVAKTNAETFAEQLQDLKADVLNNAEKNKIKDPKLEEIDPTFWYKDIKDYLTPNVVDLIDDRALLSTINNYIWKSNIDVITAWKKYLYGDLILSKENSYRVITVQPSPNYLRNNSRPRKRGLATEIRVPIIANWTTSFRNVLQLAAMINTLAITFRGQEVGTDKVSDIEVNQRWSKFLWDNNPSFNKGDYLHISEAWAFFDQHALNIKDLQEMTPYVKLDDIANFLTNYVEYIFDDQD